MKKETIIISGFMGFAIGVCSMMFVNVDKEVRYIEKINENVSENIDKTKFILQENIATCGDLIEWMNYDVERYADSTVFDSYILNLEQMIENNRNVLQTEYDN